MFFVHERARWMGVYFKAYFFGLFIGPIMSGNMAQKYGWRSFWWLTVALGVFNTVNLLFVFPETRFRRDHLPKDGAVLETPEKHETPMHLEDGHEPPAPSDPEAGTTSVQGHGRPSKQQWKLWQPINPEWRRTLVKDILSPWLKFFNPIILWAGCTTYGAANVLLFFNLTQQTLASPPWNFSPSAMGYANFAFVVGGLVGLSTAGPLCDWIAKVMTVRNNGIREAEFRLIALIPYIVIAAVGIVIGGLGLERGWSWATILCVGYGATGITVTSIPTIAIAYAVDSYTAISGDIMVVTTVIKNTTGFGMSYWVFSMVAEKGIFACAMVQFATCIGPAVLALPMYYYGKRVRRWTRNSSYHKED
jgi:MFS family permease